MNLKSIPAFLISAFSVWNPAFANGGINGAYGGSNLSLSLIGEIEQANPGVSGNISTGSKGKDISQSSLFFENISATGYSGDDGGDGFYVSGGGRGRGGDGGGSVIGGVSNGGERRKW